MSLIAAATVAAAIPFAVGCAAQETGEPALSQPIAAISNSTQLHLPIADHVPSDSTAEVIGQAVLDLTETCAERFGVHYTAHATEQPGILEGTDRRYGVVDVDEAARTGYALPGKETDDGEKWNPSEREYEVVTGKTDAGGPVTVRAADGSPVPTGGCAAEAWWRLRGDDSKLGQIVESLLNQTWTQTTEDSRARAAETSWVECMREAGHDFHHRWDAADSVKAASPEQQRAMAKLDATCALRVNYVGIWNAVDSAYQQRAITQLGDRLTKAVAAQRDLVARATEIVRAG
jgi:hypothetical protein